MTRLSARSLCEVLHNGTSKFHTSRRNSTEIYREVPQDHLLQTMHQCAVLGLYKAVYMCASSTRLLYPAVIYISTSHLLILHRAEMRCSWVLPSLGSFNWMAGAVICPGQHTRIVPIS